MRSINYQVEYAAGKAAHQGLSPLSRFIDWCESQESNRLLWLGAGLMTQGCVVTPAAFLAVAYSGLNFFLLVPVMLCIVSVLVVNMAALPTKVTIPVLFLSFTVDVLILISCIASGFNL